MAACCLYIDRFSEHMKTSVFDQPACGRTVRQREGHLVIKLSDVTHGEFVLSLHSC